MKNNNDKINTQNIQEATKLLKEMTTLFEKYNKLFTILTPQEKALSGAVVFNLVNIWEDFSLGGTIGERPLTAALINKLLVIHEQQGMMKPTMMKKDKDVN